MRWLSAVRLDARGMQRLLGALEAGIMETLWSDGERTAPEVCSAVGHRAACGAALRWPQGTSEEGARGPGSWLIAFFGGVVSFVAPCMWPMYPAYLTYLAGGGPAEAGAAWEPRTQKGQ